MSAFPLPLCSVEFSSLPEASTDPELLGLPDGACAVSASKDIGVGRTGPQEEVDLGSSPEACLAVLFTLTLGATEVLVVTGAEAVVSIEGYGRSVRLDRILDDSLSWENRTMLLMDALELVLLMGECRHRIC